MTTRIADERTIKQRSGKQRLGKQRSGKQLLWRCRRGTKELDLILSEFVADYYHELSRNEKNEFNQLLEVEDTVLTEWLCYKVTPASQIYGQGMVEIVSRILSTYRH
ncbi:succinate dehydrogenase assembly factor 2 [Candidatus Spongiihabitans sp.]|uniref:FAD assembly factor SdhE n=1 Tax=Candidatus Spongiihabitans sp. TaxID=3101308 RepID=UPI003C7E26AA